MWDRKWNSYARKTKNKKVKTKFIFFKVKEREKTIPLALVLVHRAHELVAQLRRVRARLGRLERDGASRGGAGRPALDSLLGGGERLAGDVRRLGSLLELEVVSLR